MLTNDEVTVMLLKAQAFWNKWKSVEEFTEEMVEECNKDMLELLKSSCMDGRKKIADFFIDEIIARQQRAGKI